MTLRLGLLASTFAVSLLAGCGGSGSDEASGGADPSASADGATTTTEAAGPEGCPETSEYTITGPDGDVSFTAASAYARETNDYLSLFLFSKDFPEDEIDTLKEEIQKLLKKHEDEIDRLLEAKIKEVQEV